MRLDLQREAQTVRNVAEVIERTLASVTGAPIAVLRKAICKTCGVRIEHFERAVRTLITMKRIHKIGGDYLAKK